MIIDKLTLPIEVITGRLNGSDYFIRRHHSGKLVLSRKPTYTYKKKSPFPEFKELSLEARRIYYDKDEVKYWKAKHDKEGSTKMLYQYIVSELCKQFKQSKQ